MLFLVLIVAFFVGASITGVFFDYDAEAKKTQFTTPKVGDEIGIKAKGTGICTSSENSDTAKTNVRFLLQVTEADGDISNGVGKTKINLQTKCEGAPKAFENDGPLSFSYDANSNVLVISGVLIDKEGITYSIDGIGQINEGKKTTIDMHLAIESDPGVGVILQLPILGTITT